MGRTTFYKALPPGALAAPGIEVRTVAGLPPKPIFTHLCRLVIRLGTRSLAGAPALLDPHPLSGWRGQSRSN